MTTPTAIDNQNWNITVELKTGNQERVVFFLRRRTKSTRRKQLQCSAAGGEKQTLLTTDEEDQSAEGKICTEPPRCDFVRGTLEHEQRSVTKISENSSGREAVSWRRKIRDGIGAAAEMNLK
jgi:hypothetical protein